MELSPSWEAANCLAAQKFPNFYVTRMFITVFTKPNSPYPEPDQSSPYHPTLSLRCILILSTHLHLGLPSVLFPSEFPTKILYTFLFPHWCYMPCPSHPSWLGHSNYVWRGVQVMKLLIMRFSSKSYNFISPMSKYYPQHRVCGWGTTLKAGRSLVRFLMRSLDFSIDLILPAAQWPWGRRE
jgi:hypothetical protein